MNSRNLLVRLFQPSQAPSVSMQVTWAVLRVVAGVVMIHNGMNKLDDIESFAEAYVAFIGLPFPIFLSYVAAYTELIGAPLVAFGFLTRPAAFGLFGTMCVAMYHHVLVAGFSLPYLELSALYAAVFLFFTLNGAGLYSFDAPIANALDQTALSDREKTIMGLERAYESSETKPAESVARR